MSIKLSPQHGLNPSLALCYYCGEAKGVAILGMQKGDRVAPREAAFDKHPCKACEGFMEIGVVLCSVSNNAEGENPHRTGCFCVVKDHVLDVIQNVELRERILQVRFAFVPDDVWDLMGLPRGDVNDGETLQ